MCNLLVSNLEDRPTYIINTTRLNKSANLWLDKDQRRPSRSNKAVKVFERICGGVWPWSWLSLAYAKLVKYSLKAEKEREENHEPTVQSLSVLPTDHNQKGSDQKTRTEAKLSESEAKWRTEGWKPLNVGPVLPQERVGNYQHRARENSTMPGHTIITKMGKDIETLSKDFRSPQIPLIQGVLGAS